MSFTRGLVSCVCIATLGLGGCIRGAQVQRISKTYIGTERVFDKNYEINQRQDAFVGQSIVKVKDYKVKKFSARKMRASHNFTMSGGIVAFSGYKHTDYEVYGQTVRDGVAYTVLKIPRDAPSGGPLGVLVDAEGRVQDTVIVLKNNIVVAYDFVATPPDVRFTGSIEREIDVDAGYLNYELIYGGTDGQSIKITYREYTPDDMAKYVFFQNVTYEVDAKQIRFRDTVIQVHDVNSEKISYSIVTDGLSAK